MGSNGGFPKGNLKDMRVPLAQVQKKSLDARSAVQKGIQKAGQAGRPNLGAD